MKKIIIAFFLSVLFQLGSVEIRSFIPDWFQSLPKKGTGDIATIGYSYYSEESAIILALVLNSVGNSDDRAIFTRKIGESVSLVSMISFSENEAELIGKISYSNSNGKKRIVKLRAVAKLDSKIIVLDKPIIDEDQVTEIELIEYMKKSCVIESFKISKDGKNGWFAVSVFKNE